MKIQIASDLHLDLARRFFPKETLIEDAGADVLVLAGDIHSGADGLEVFARQFPRTEIVYVAGNHEFYHDDISAVLDVQRDVAKELGIHFLENHGAVIGGVRFLGCTLWTDYELKIVSENCHEYSFDEKMMRCNRYLADHMLVALNGQKFRPTDALQIHKASRAWLEEELSKPFDGPTVVVTHHAPHFNSTPERYRTHPASAGFASDLTPLLSKASVWIHGHTHDSMDYTIEGCRVIANPAGYIRRTGSPPEALENQTFNPRLIVEI